MATRRSFACTRTTTLVSSRVQALPRRSSPYIARSAIWGPPFTRAERGFERWFWRIGLVVVHGRTRAEEHAPWSVACRSS